jgi:hypothetical protein
MWSDTDAKVAKRTAVKPSERKKWSVAVDVADYFNPLTQWPGSTMSKKDILVQ